MIHARIVLEELTEDRAPMTIDTVLDASMRIAHQIPFGGWWGKIRSNWFRPIVFQPDGIIRFGSDPEDSYEEGHSKMNVFDVEFRVGTRISYLDLEDGESIDFVVKQIVDLADLSVV